MAEVIGHYKYHKKDLIGNGAFAAVFKGQKIGSSLLVAIKRISRSSLSDTQWILRELKMMQEITKLQHKNIVCLLDFSLQLGLIDGIAYL